MADKTLPPVAIGDSLAVGMREANNLPGIARVGAGPKEVYEMLQRFATSESLSGRDVFIGTGMPNIPEQKKFIEQQIDFVRKQGGNPILIGVGPGTKSKPTTGQNEFLAGLAERKGLTYMGPLQNMFPEVTKDPMGLHLRAPQYKQLFKQFSQPQSGKNDQGKLIVPMPYSPKEGGDKTVTRVPMPYSPKEGDDKAIRNSIQPMPFSGSAADLLSQFTGAVMQAESQGKRYDKEGRLLTSSAGAMGEMQVMPKTVRDPGFGVRPAKDNSPNELARVGRDYAAVMLRRYNNNPTAAAVAYNWGPGNADKWVKRGADFSALPKETQNYVTRITGQMGVPIAAKRVPPPPKRVEKAMVPRAEAEIDYAPGSTLDTAPRSAEQQPQQNVVTRADVDRLGPSYQAALAAMTLGDSREDEDDYDDEETITEKYMERRGEQLAREESTLEEEEPTRTSSLADLDLSYQSPFPQEQQPVMMAEGGDPAEEKDIDYKEYVREQLRKDALYAGLGDGDRGSARRELATFDLNDDPRIALMLAGNAGEIIRDPVTGAVIGSGVPAIMGRLGIDKDGARAGVSGAAVRLPDGSVKVFPGSADVGYSTPLYKGNLDISADYGLGNLPRPMYGGRVRYSQSFKDGGLVYRADGSPVYGEMADTGGITEDTRKAFANRQSFNAREALAALKRIAGEGVSNFESLARGSVAGVPGVVGDIESIFRDDKNRKFATSEEVERQYLPKRMTAPTKESQGFVEIGTAIDPTIALKAAPKTAKAALKAIKESGPQVESALMKAAPAAQPMNIIKYEGGNWMPTRERSDVVNDYIANLMKDSGVQQELKYKKDFVNIYQDGVDSAKSIIEKHKDFIKGLYEGRNPEIPPVAKAERSKKIALAQSYREGAKSRKQQLAESQQKLDEAQAELARPQSIANFIEKKLQPYIRNNLGTPSDQVRVRMDKWELEEQPKLIAEKQKQIDKVRADINRAASSRGNIDPLILTRSQEQLRKLMNEMEGIRSRTGSFFQMGRGEREAMLRRYDMVRGSSPRGEIGTINFPATPTVAKSGLGKIWEETVDFSMDAYKPSEAASEYASIYGKEPPAWLTKAAESGDNKGIYSLDYRSGETLPYQFRHMIDELMSSVDPQTNLPKELRRTPKEIEKMSVDDAAALVDKINGWRASNTTGLDLARANNPAVFEVRTYKTVPNTNIPNERNLRWVEIKMPPEYKDKKQAKKVLDDALKYEGEIMKHCVGTYCPKVEEGTKIFSLRDDAGRPYTTIEAAPDMDVVEEIFKKEFGESSWERNFKPTSDAGLIEILTQELGQAIPYKIKQIKGVRNGAPIEEVVPFVKDFVSDPQWTDVADINLIGGL